MNKKRNLKYKIDKIRIKKRIKKILNENAEVEAAVLVIAVEAGVDSIIENINEYSSYKNNIIKL